MTAMPPNIVKMLARGQIKLGKGGRVVVQSPDQQHATKTKARRRKANKVAKASRKVNRGRH